MVTDSPNGFGIESGFALNQSIVGDGSGVDFDPPSFLGNLPCIFPETPRQRRITRPDLRLLPRIAAINADLYTLNAFMVSTIKRRTTDRLCGASFNR